MTIAELADFIRKNKPASNFHGVHFGGDHGVVVEHTRGQMNGNVHLTEEHIFECCEKAGSYEEHITLCLPFAITDTEKWKLEQKKPVPKGRTRRRFR